MQTPPRPVSPADPRDLAGPFSHELQVEVRFADTDAMRHVNNAKYLTYCEIARIRYWTEVTGRTAESLILAEARITYRAQVYYGETVTVQTRATRIGRSSFTLEHRLTAAVRLRDAAPDAAVGRVRRSHRGVRGPPAQVTARKMVTAFWPPNPKPLTATVSTFALRAVSGT
jgi:acyl-CoA thioester hydrolase